MSPPLAPPRPARAAARTTAAVGLLALILAGCSSIHARKTPLRNALHVRLGRAGLLHTYSEPTTACLRRADLLEPARHDPDQAAEILEQSLPPCPAGDALLVLAELWERAASSAGATPAAALPRYRAAAAYAAFALAAPADTETAARATELHNRAVEQMLRLAQGRRGADGRPWADVLADGGVTVASPALHLDPARLADVQPARDFRVRGMQAYYANDGLGVPLVAHRVNDRDRPAIPQDRYFPYDLRAAATAVLHPDGPYAADWRQRPVALVLHDPFTDRRVDFGGPPARLASDRTTPLAVQVSTTPFTDLEITGLLRPDVTRAETGIYMIQPYRPGKIPVVLVHGLHSSPVTWAQTVNHLQNDPVLGERFQFWMFLYPTGDPLPASADDLRRALREALDTFDPAHTDPALGAMVLVGHSLGGLVSKMLVQDSGTLLWDTLFTVPFDELRASPEIKAALARRLFYRPEPYVRRVVFISTPHAGTPFVTRLFVRLLEALIRRPDELTAIMEAIGQANGRDVVVPGVRGRRLNGIAELRPGDPILRAVERAGITPGVPYHSIIPQLGLDGIDLPTDGIVPYRSSHIDGAASEQITRGRHISHGSAEATAELKRILCQHLRELGD